MNPQNQGFRKSIFWAEKKHAPTSPSYESNAAKADNNHLLAAESNSIFASPELSNQYEGPPTPFSAVDKSLGGAQNGTDDVINTPEHLLSPLSEKGPLIMNSPDKVKGVQKKLQNALQGADPSLSSIEGNRQNSFRRPPALVTKKPSIFIANNDANIKVVPAPEEPKDDQNDLQPMSDADQTFISGNEAFSEVSEDFEEEHEMDPARQLVRKRLRKVFYASYFIGVAISLQNRIRLYGTLKPIAEVDNAENEVKTTKENGYLPLMPSNNFRVAWTIILVIMLLMTTMLTPYDVSFIDEDNRPFLIINRVFDVTFAIDILLNFISAYYDPAHGLVTDLKSIALQYVKTWFLIDLVACLPLDLMIPNGTSNTTNASQKINKLLRLLRFPRLYRLFKILRLFKVLKLFSTSQSFNKVIKKLNLNIGIMKMLKFVLNIFFLNHFVGCLWFFVARLYDFSPETWVAKHSLIDADSWTQYIASTYWALQTLTTVGFGDFAPGTPTERIIAILWMIVGVGVYSFTIGNLSSILSNMDRRATILKKKISTFNNFASKVKLPDFLRQKVQRFFELNHKENVYYWIDPSDMLKHLPENLKSTLLLYSYHNMIKDIELLELNANFTASLLLHLKLLKLDKKEILYREDDPSQEIYFISKGSVKMVTENGMGIYTLVQGTYFGELEILEGSKRLCFAQACEVSIIIVCDKNVFLEALKEFPDVEAKVQKVAKYRKEKMDKKFEQLVNDDAANVEQNPGTKPNKKPLLKSAEYFFNVLSKTRKRLKKDETPQNSRTNQGSYSKNASDKSYQGDHLESFRKLQDFTGAIGKANGPSLLNKLRPSVFANEAASELALSEKDKSVDKLSIADAPVTKKKSLASKIDPKIQAAIVKGDSEDTELLKTKEDSPELKESVEDNKNESADQNKQSDSAAQIRIRLAQQVTRTSNSVPLEPLILDEPNPTGEDDKTGKDNEGVQLLSLKKQMTSEEGDFTKEMKHYQEVAAPARRLEDYKLIQDRAERLNFVKEWFMKVREMKEKTDSIYSDMDFKKLSVVQNFTVIADKQKEINTNVEKLFTMIK